MLPASARLPAVGTHLDVQCGDFIADATVTAIDADSITLQFHGNGATYVLPMASALSIDWYPNAGQA